MWFSTTLWAVRPRTPARCRQALLATLCLLLPAFLSGCGGGGGSSTTDEGFRFVPDGSGAVIPNPNVQFNYDAGSVTSGVIVTAAPVTAGLPAAPKSNPAPQLSAYQITFSTAEVAFNSQARVYLPFMADPTSLSVPRIYLYSPVADSANGIVMGWRVLPASAVLPAPGTTTANTLEALLPSVIESGSILAVYADTPPPVVGVPVTVTGP